MKTSEFWKLIEKRKRGVEPADEQAEKLEGILANLSQEKILSFDRIFNEYRYAAYRWDLWGVAYLLCGGCGDDSFDYFRAWLIGCGQKYYEEAISNPESVARKVTAEDYPEAEFLLYAASKAYQKQTGRDMPRMPVKHPKEPAGKNWKEEELPNLFPSLTRRRASVASTCEKVEPAGCTGRGGSALLSFPPQRRCASEPGR